MYTVDQIDNYFKNDCDDYYVSFKKISDHKGIFTVLSPGYRGDRIDLFGYDDVAGDVFGDGDDEVELFWSKHYVGGNSLEFEYEELFLHDEFEDNIRNFILFLLTWVSGEIEDDRDFMLAIIQLIDKFKDDQQG